MLDVREGARGRGGFESVLEIFSGDIGGVSVRVLDVRERGVQVTRKEGGTYLFP
jgi:hypothetical protein